MSLVQDRDKLLGLGETVVGKAVRRGFSEAALSMWAFHRVMVKLANTRISTVQDWMGVKVQLYLSKNQKIYVAEAVFENPLECEKLVEKTLNLIDKLGKAEPYAPLPEPTGRPLDGLADNKLRNALESAAEHAEAIIEGASSLTSRAMVAGVLTFEYGHRIVVTSRGASFAEEKTALKTYARVIVDDVSGQWAFTSSRLDERGLRRVGEKAAYYALEARRRVHVEVGRYTAILGPLVVGNLMDMLAFMASGYAVLTGMSIFVNRRLGERIGSEKITVYDAPHRRELPGATGFDDEGVATRDKPIVEKGVVKNLLHNSRTAKALDDQLTGNAGYIVPSAWNLVIEPGDVKLEEMIAETKRGLLVTNNWYTRFQNFVEGVFSTVTRDALLYIENGEVKGGTARLRIADTYTNLLSNIVEVSRETEQVEWWEIETPTIAPYIKVEKLNFTKSA